MATKVSEAPPLAKRVAESIEAEKPKRETFEEMRVLYTIRLEAEHINNLKDLATIAGVSHAEIARRALYEFIAKEKANKPAPAAKKTTTRKAATK